MVTVFRIFEQFSDENVAPISGAVNQHRSGVGTGRSSPDNQRRIIHTAFDSGITHFDLANNYGPPYGSAEVNVGRILKDLPR